MSVLGLRVGPFEIVEECDLPGPGRWHVASRVGHARRTPSGVLVDILPHDAGQADRTALQASYEALRSLDDPRVPRAVAFYEGIGALVVEGEAGVGAHLALEAASHGRVRIARSTVLDLGAELIEVLQHAHARGRVHGHLEPGHLRIGDDGRLWLWGLERPEALASEPYRAPEVARGERATVATDQWSVGALLLALALGRPPHLDGLDDELGFVRERSPGLARILERMLDDVPERRFESLAPVRQELLALERRADDFAARRELGHALATLATSDVDVHAEVTAIRVHEPEAEPTMVLGPADAAGRGPLPDEQFPVVEPDDVGDLPTARRSSPAPSAAAVVPSAPLPPPPVATAIEDASEDEDATTPEEESVDDPGTPPTERAPYAPVPTADSEAEEVDEDAVEAGTAANLAPVEPAVEREAERTNHAQTVALALIAAMSVMMILYLAWRWLA